MQKLTEEHAGAMLALESIIAALGKSETQSVSEQVASLKKERDALAAENSKMLQLLTDISDNHEEFVNDADDYLYASVPLDYVSEINMYVSRDVNAENPFAATDAALTEMQDQGVDMAIEHLIKKFELTGRIGVPVMALEWLAAELRKGAAV